MYLLASSLADLLSPFNIVLLAGGVAVGVTLYIILARQSELVTEAPPKSGAEVAAGNHYQAKDLVVYHQLRRDRRVKVVHPVSVSAPDGTFEASSREIGAGGMSMVTDANLKIAQPLELSFTLPEQKITVPAVVWWKKGNLVGVRFDVTDERRLWISKWVEEQVAEPAK